MNATPETSMNVASETSMNATLCALILLVMMMGGCSKEQSPRQTCGVTGATVECACPGGAKGAQTCQADGSFGPCQCTEAPAAKSPDQDQPEATETESSSEAEQPGKPSTSCDPTGIWTVTSKPKGSTGCAGDESLTDRWNITKTGAQSWAIAKTDSTPAQPVSVSDKSGACIVQFSETIETCPSCRPPEEIHEYSFTLAVSGENVKGTLDLRVEPSMDDEEDGAKPCSQSYVVKGTRNLID